MKTIYLIGFMGSGKTTIGKLLAKELQKRFVDTDQYIEENHGKIPDIFQKQGEEVFRLHEVQALKETISFEVVATGGGIVEKEENHETMQQNGIIIYLHTTFQEINKRLKRDQNRPLWDQNVTENLKRYEERLSKYREVCDYEITTDGKTVDGIVEEVIRMINV